VGGSEDEDGAYDGAQRIGMVRNVRDFTGKGGHLGAGTKEGLHLLARRLVWWGR